MINRVRGIYEASPHQMTIVPYHGNSGTLAVPSRLNTAQKRWFTMQYVNKTLVFGQVTAVYDDL